MKAKKYVAYYRVSTKEQGISGLGLNDQKFAVKTAIGKKNIAKEFIEIESGKKRNRPQLEAAILHCQENGTGMVVAKLDRLGRNAGHLFQIRENIKDLYICDKPNMGTLEFGIFAALAQEEAETISRRTKAALAVKKRQGINLGLLKT